MRKGFSVKKEGRRYVFVVVIVVVVVYFYVLTKT